MALLIYFVLPVEYRNADGVLQTFDPPARAALAVMVWMAVWWLTEAIDVAATALLPVALFPLLGVADVRAAAAPYASEMVFLFFGGFALALAMQRWGLDRRVALLTLHLTGTRPAAMVAGFMFTAAFLSAFISNTATAAMMLPIALGVVALNDRRQTDPDPESANSVSVSEHFAPCLLLGVAYAASIGGAATLVGTPPNLYLAGFVEHSIAAPFRQSISFVSWLAIGVPLAALLLPITWLLLTRLLFPLGSKPLPGGDALIREQYRQLGPPGRGERLVIAVFLLTAAAWITRPLLNQLQLSIGGISVAPLSGLSDAGIAVLAALALFVLPVAPQRHQFVLDWPTVVQLPWGVLILFGGGLSLAAAVQSTGAADFIGAQAGRFADWPSWLLILAVVLTIIFFTELSSNTAAAATLVPVLAALAPGVGLHPLELIVPATVAASCAFMMPVATPPNAIVFGSGRVSVAQMCRAGLWLNLISALLISLLLPELARGLLSA